MFVKRIEHSIRRAIFIIIIISIMMFLKEWTFSKENEHPKKCPYTFQGLGLETKGLVRVAIYCYQPGNPCTCTVPSVILILMVVCQCRCALYSTCSLPISRNMIVVPVFGLVLVFLFLCFASLAVLG